jgi:hypothetical protein
MAMYSLHAIGLTANFFSSGIQPYWSIGRPQTGFAREQWPRKVPNSYNIPVPRDTGEQISVRGGFTKWSPAWPYVASGPRAARKVKYNEPLGYSSLPVAKVEKIICEEIQILDNQARSMFPKHNSGSANSAPRSCGGYSGLICTLRNFTTPAPY